MTRGFDVDLKRAVNRQSLFRAAGRTADESSCGFAEFDRRQFVQIHPRDDDVSQCMHRSASEREIEKNADRFRLNGRFVVRRIDSTVAGRLDGTFSDPRRFLGLKATK